jgi:predicted helicase
MGSGDSPNFAGSFLKALAAALVIPLTATNGMPKGLDAEAIFDYAYAVLYCPGYRSRYAEFLKVDFPRLPLPGSVQLFRKLAAVGRELVAVQLMESPKLSRAITNYSGPKNPEVGRASWSDGTIWLNAAASSKGRPASSGSIGFHGVPEAAWNFHIGGYQVCEKWLKDRKGRTLSDEDILHYQKIVVALSETIRLMAEIDQLIEQHGGWPGAFQTSG